MKFFRRIRAGFVKGKLSDVRKKDPELEKAALFVEKLFGRPLRNDPTVIELVPWLPFVTYEGEYLNYPRKSIERTNKLYKWIAGFTPFDPASILSHELVHSEDFFTPEKTTGMLQKLKQMWNSAKRRIVMEGRAVFAQHIFKGKIKRFEQHFLLLAAGAAGLIVSAFTNLPPVASTISAISIAIGALYWPFHSALCTLSKRLGDPVEAFRLSTERPPSLLGIIAPSRFYKKEIEKTKRSV